jgi:hypothetical protein
MQLRHLFSLVLAMPLASLAQTAVFTDNFSTGSDTLNGTSTPGGTAAASWTSWDIAATKAATTVPVINPGSFKLSLNGATTSGLVEAQAVFANSAITLANNGDFIDLQMTFTDQTAFAGGTGSYLYAGLYNSGGTKPAIGLNNGGLTSAAGSAFATGNAASWQGYVARASSGGSSGTWVRPVQNGSGTASGNQDLVGNNVSNGATYNNPIGLQIGSSSTQSPALTAGLQYTLDLKLTYDGVGSLTLADNLYSGVGTGGANILSQTTTATGSTLVTTTFDGLAIGLRNSGTSLNPEIDINQLNIVAGIASIPEPGTFALAGLGAAALLIFRRRRS